MPNIARFVLVYAPDEAYEGEYFLIVAHVQNISTILQTISVLAMADGQTIGFTPGQKEVLPGNTEVFVGPATPYPPFYMPNHDVRIEFFSFYWDGLSWVRDDYAYKDVKLIVPAIQDFALTEYVKV